MSFRNYLNEDVNIEKLKEIIKKNCQPVLKELYRNNFNEFPLIGKKRNLKEGFKIRKVRKNRTPRDTPPEIHDFIDEYFEENYGIRGRGECIFCTGKYSQAHSYGHVYIVLPIGNFQFLWSPRVNDLYSALLENDIGTKNAIYSLATGESINDDFWYKEDEWTEEWKEFFGEGEKGQWVFYDIESGENNEEAAINSILDQLGFDIDYDIDYKDAVHDIYSDVFDYVKNIQKQKNLFNEDIIISKLDHFNGLIQANMFQNEEGEYYIRNSEGEIITDKHGQKLFDNKEDAWNSYKKWLVRDTVKNKKIPVDKWAIDDFYDEDWAQELLRYWKYDTYKQQLFDVIQDNLKWEPEMTLDNFLEVKKEDYGFVENEDLEQEVYEILSSYIKNGDLVRAINSENEIMLDCDKYILINWEYKEELKTWIKSGNWRSSK